MLRKIQVLLISVYYLARLIKDNKPFILLGSLVRDPLNMDRSRVVAVTDIEQLTEGVVSHFVDVLKLVVSTKGKNCERI